MKQLRIMKVQNGFIVKVLDGGESLLKELYMKRYYVFGSKKELRDWLEDFWGAE